ncbi:phage holin, lambda family [Kosakonia sacchari]|uniref:phage holin, lambda family n=1 Tax=Kosakonia sacchari TaxID=1158459 RepID=UPI001585847D|nr:phage holin, lambda family [Kosakonia sacchari]NUL36618.1 phage holin, lambda family [Kosakonia sacchari]
MNKDPGFLADLYAGIKQAWPQISGAGLAVLICYGRLICDGAERKSNCWWLEPLICGLITWAATSGLTFAMAVWLPNSVINPQSLSPLVGGAVGLLGVKKLRAIAMKKLGVSDESK